MTQIKGIDVSVWQGSIDFKKVAKSGIKFVIIKAGGSDDGFYKDSRFDTNYKNAKSAGLAIGCYYFVGTDFNTSEKGKTNAKKFAEIIKGKAFDYPVFLDLESTSTAQKTGVTKACIAFLDYLKSLGYNVGIYASAISGFKDRLDTSKLNNYHKWVAQYLTNKPTYPSNYTIWQYSSTGSVNGINGNVDMDICYYDYTKTSNKSNATKNKVNATTSKTEKTHSEYKAKYRNLVEAIVKGKYGNGDIRKNKVIAKGYDYNLAQKLVNAYLLNTSNFNTVFNLNRVKYDKVADNVLKGKYGNGITRYNKLRSLGYDYDYIQALVNAKIGS